MSDLLRDRILEEAAALAAAEGWSAVTMSRLASVVGVSRQTIYNEVGTRADLAGLLVRRELEGILRVVRSELSGESDLATDLGRAAGAVLRLSGSRPLVVAIAAGPQGRNTALLPLVTVQSQPLRTVAELELAERIRSHYEVPGDVTADIVDVVVRYVLSHMMQPDNDSELVAGTVTRVTAALLASARSDCGSTGGY